jgi:hypothetical protein
MSESMPQDLTLAAWRMAITKRQPGPGLLHHADRGSQSAAHDDRRLLDGHGMICSMSRNGKCWDNAPRESFFGSLKTELPVDRPFPTRQAARTALFRFIEGFYNCSSQRTSRYIVDRTRFCCAGSDTAGRFGLLRARDRMFLAAGLSRSTRRNSHGPSWRGWWASISPRSAASRSVRAATPTTAAAWLRLSQGSMLPAASQ